jgi:hypothetical protein
MPPFEIVALVSQCRGFPSSEVVALVSSIVFFFAATFYFNLAILQSASVWSSMEGAQYPIFLLLGLGTLISFSYSVPDGHLRRKIPWVGRAYIPPLLIFLFWSVEISLFIWSVRFYANTIAGTANFLSWFVCGFTPMISVSCLGGGFGAVMIAFTFPAWLFGCTSLGLLYCLIASSGAPQLCVVLSCVLKISLLLVAPGKGFLGGKMLSQRPESPVSEPSTPLADAC